MTRRRNRGRGSSRRLVGLLLGLTACLLAGDIAFVGLSLADSFGLAAGPKEDSAAIATADRFYGAVNAMIASGDPAPLSATVDPFYVEHSAGDDTDPPGRDGLIATVLRLRQIAPALRIAVISASATPGERTVTVRLRVTGGETGAFLGLALPSELVAGGWGPIEIVRVAQGKVAERWSWPESSARLQPLVQAALPSSDGTPRMVSLMRVTLAPHAEVEIENGLAMRLLFVESGAATIGVRDGHPGTAVPPPATGLPLPTATAIPATPGEAFSAGGDRLSLPGEHAVIANADGGEVSLLVITRFGVGSGTGAAEELAAAARTDLAGIASSRSGLVAGSVLGVATFGTTAGQTLAVGRVTLPANSRLTWTASPSPAVIAVEQGTLALSDAGGLAGIRADGRSWQGDESPLAAGDAVAFVAADGSWQTAAAALPATVLMLTLSAGNAEGGG